MKPSNLEPGLLMERLILTQERTIEARDRTIEDQFKVIREYEVIFEEQRKEIDYWRNKYHWLEGTRHGSTNDVEKH